MEKNCMEFAPVIIPTLCRFEHLKRCVDSLSRCTDANQTEIYIGLDYPSKESHWDGYNKINKYLNTITGFKEVVVIRHDKNVGSSGNTRALKNLIENKYDRYIYSEDDEEFSPNFLQYMNACLGKYKNDNNIIAICSYNNPVCDFEKMLVNYDYNVFPMHGYNAHAVGLWFEKKPKFISKDEILNHFKIAFRAIKNDHAIAVRTAMFLRGNVSQLTDVGRELFCSFNNKYCIFPRISKVRNWGFDGTGENSEIFKSFEKMEIDTEKTFTLDEISIKDYPEIKRLEKRVYGFSKWYMNLYITIDYVYFRIRGCRLIESRIVMLLRRFVS